MIAAMLGRRRRAGVIGASTADVGGVRLGMCLLGQSDSAAHSMTGRQIRRGAANVDCVGIRYRHAQRA